MLRECAPELAAGLAAAARLDDVALRLCLGLPPAHDKRETLPRGPGSPSALASGPGSGILMEAVRAVRSRGKKWPPAAPKDLADVRGKVMETSADSIATSLHAVDALVGASGTGQARALAHATAGRLAHAASTILVLRSVCAPLSAAAKRADTLGDSAEGAASGSGAASKDGEQGGKDGKKLSRAERFRQKMLAKRKAKQKKAAPLPTKVGDASAVTVATSLLEYLWHFAPGFRPVLVSVVATTFAYAAAVASEAELFAGQQASTSSIRRGLEEAAGGASSPCKSPGVGAGVKGHVVRLLRRLQGARDEGDGKGQEAAAEQGHGSGEDGQVEVLPDLSTCVWRALLQTPRDDAAESRLLM